jgi:hypothetical protein
MGDTGNYSTVYAGGSRLDKSYGASRAVSNAQSIDILSSVDYNRADIWPFSDDTGGIAKVVDVTVSVTDSKSNSPTIDIERHPLRQHKVVLEGGGLWGVRMEDQIKRPDRSLPGTLYSRSSTPEWERLPDLLPMEELRKLDSDDSVKTGKSPEASPHSSPKPQW